MKTEKYAIQFISCETVMTKEIPISKAEFKKQLAFLAEQTRMTAGTGNAVDHYSDVEENEKIKIIRYRFSVGMGDVWLSCYSCKPGYHFK